MELFRIFRKSGSHPDAQRVETVLKLIGRADDESLFHTTFRLGETAQFVQSECGSAEMSFAEFKARLRPDQARAISAKARSVRMEVKKQSAAPALAEMALMLVAASLDARGGAEWVSREAEAIIDDLIKSGEQLLKRYPQEPRTKRQSYADSPQTEEDCFLRVLGYLGDEKVDAKEKETWRQGLTRAIGEFKQELKQDNLSLPDLLNRLTPNQAAAIGAKQQKVAIGLWQQGDSQSKLVSEYVMLIAIVLLSRAECSSLQRDDSLLVERLVAAADPLDWMLKM